MKITKLGHCCLIIEINGVRFLTDPGNYTTLQNEVTAIDAVVITHEHTDHIHMESLKIVLANNPHAIVITNASVGKLLAAENIAFTQISHGEKTEVKDVTIEGHGLKHALIYRTYEQVENTGYLFAAAGSTHNLFYPGDAFYNPGVPVDILAFPITAPWSKISESVDYILEVKPRIAFPVHDGNVIRHGLTTRLPDMFLKESGIGYVFLETGKETEL